MKWVENHQVEGTDPLVTIGKPTRRNSKTGRLIASKTFHERYTVNGRQVTKTLKTGNRKEAIRRVLQRQWNGDEERETQAQISIGDGLNEYLEICRHRDLAPRTLQKYELVIRELKSLLSKRLTAPLPVFSEREFWRYNKYMTEAGHERKTRYDRLIVVKQAMKYLVRVGRIQTNPLEAVRMSKPESRPQPCFTMSQVADLLSATDDYHRPIFATMAYAGLRFGEVRDLRWEDLLFDRGANGIILVARGGSRDIPKDRESRRLPIHPNLRSHLDALSRLGERVFYDRDGKRSLSQKKLLRALKNLCAERGFEQPRQYKLHSFRHFFCSVAAQNNLSYRYVLSWLGHSDSKIVEMYFNIFDDTAEQAMSSIQFENISENKKGVGCGELQKEENRIESESGGSEVRDSGETDASYSDPRTYDG